jgi:DUF4097 and DUF4098 domain-containing protein YvlB
MVLVGLVIFVLVGCNSLQSGKYHPVERKYSAAGISEIQVEMQAGQLSVVGEDFQELVLSASLAKPDLFTEAKQGSMLMISLTESGNGDEVTLRIPEGVILKIDTFSADVHLTDYNGQIEISSVAGNIVLDSIVGEAWLWAGRGDVDVQNGQGDQTIIGEHGVLSVSGFDGNVSMSTIMGKLEYTAAEGVSGFTSLESDHGPVEVLMSESANFNIFVNTTSGFVTCLGADIAQTVSGCERVIGDATGILEIRTVSGRIDLKVVATMPEGQND